MANGKVADGGRYYAITHAYYHLIFDIVEMLGPQRARVKNVRFIYSCRRGWTEFFQDGVMKDTTFHKWPNGEISWINIFDWEHPIPGGGECS